MAGREARRFLCSSVDSMYQEAVRRLNSLQSNPAVLEQIRLSNKPRVSSLEQMYSCLDRVGLAPEALNRLAAVHVAGSKGKGSVCAMVERILREYNLKTGFYSSPHLREVRERMRINGLPISRAQFVDSFWRVYSQLEDSGGTMPAYFRFLTLMAVQLFLEEEVDVAVIEVGLGGAFDCTNVIPSPTVCGVSSLLLEHTEVLGNSIEDIAWQKAGIAKPGRPIFTVPQESRAMKVLRERTQEIGSGALQVAPALTSYPGPPLKLSLTGEHQTQNAELAIVLAKSWLQLNDKESWRKDSEALPAPFRTALEDCCWPGRNQVIHRHNITYYVDGAHTPDSVENCAQWFTRAAEGEATQLGKERVLVFNTTGNRESQDFLQPLLDCGFTVALFPTNLTKTPSPDTDNLTASMESMLRRAGQNHSTWLQLGGSESSSQHLPTIDEAVGVCQVLSSDRHVQVLVTGSLHLVGALMNILDQTIH